MSVDINDLKNLFVRGYSACEYKFSGKWREGDGMTLLEKMGHAAEAVGCEDEIKAADDVIRNLSAGNTAGIAVLGEENCGKTALMNKLAGQEVRKTTVLSMNEPPLMVIFGSGEEKPGFETAEVQAGQMAADVTIYEIPLSMAVAGTTGNILPMLDENGCRDLCRFCDNAAD